MKITSQFNNKAIAATFVAAIAFPGILASCQGRKMSNMQPAGDTVEVVISSPDSESDTTATDMDMTVEE